jgi:hypothetical protein
MSSEYQVLFEEFDDDQANQEMDEQLAILQEEGHFHRVIDEFAGLISDYGVGEVFKNLSDDVLYDIIKYLEDEAN